MIYFHILSYGGCGSTMLTKFLSRYGKTYHDHPRIPHDKLRCGFGTPNYNPVGDIIDKKDIKNHKVIFIYRNPVEATLSTLLKSYGKCHLTQVTPRYEEIIKMGIDNYLTQSEVDILNYKEFFDNYVNRNYNSNYDIICIKYEDMWSNLETIFQLLDIPLNDIKKFPSQREIVKNDIQDIEIMRKNLYKLNESLLKEIDRIPPVKVIQRKNK